MKFRGRPHFRHDEPDCTGILITNLGTPDEPTTPALRRYLRQFLWDPRVVEVPRPLWWLILNMVILRIRPRRSAASYRTVFTDRGSPLLFHTRDQAEALRKAMAERGHGNLVVDFAMRYGSPSIPSVLDSMLERGVRRLLVLPLYPQYSASTTASTFDAISEDFTRRRWLPDLRFITTIRRSSRPLRGASRPTGKSRAGPTGCCSPIMAFRGVTWTRATPTTVNATRPPACWRSGWVWRRPAG